MLYSDLEILDNPDGLKVDEIRELAYKSSSSSYEGNRKIFIIKDISKMKKEASNALLKLIEEPNKGSFFISFKYKSKYSTYYKVQKYFSESEEKDS